MTEDQSAHVGRQHGGVELPPHVPMTTGDYEQAEEQFGQEDVDHEGHELHASGQMCVRCGRPIRPQDDVRRTASGAYEHEVCDIVADTGPGATAG
jgi:hypothetical protein